jgi:ATP-binding cassette subfamily F protein uup
MNILSVEQISKSFGARVLFSNLSFGISQGQKVALVARNGTGKTTLLNILAGLDSADSGLVTYRKGLKVNYLPQDPQLPSNMRLIDYLLGSDMEEMQAIRNYEWALLHPDNMEGFDQALAEMERLQAWDTEVRIKQILSQLKLDAFDAPISGLSGGQKKRLALARALVDQPDFLILDEPTNHLDFDMVEWLENTLGQSGLTLFLVTHDRYFLEAVCDQIIELEQGNLFTYPGSYGNYLEKKAERIMQFQSSTEKAQNLYRKELEWMRRQPKARSTKAKARVDNFSNIETAAKQKLKDERVKLEMKVERLGSKILEVHKLRKSFDNLKIVDGFSYVFKSGDRIGIVGPNGVGKSTFLRMLNGEIAPDGGKVVSGETLVTAHYKQDGMQLKDDKRVIEVVKEIAEFIPLTKGQKLTASQLLERFLFEGDAQYTFVSKLSGGEKRRLFLLTLLMKNPNFLILDEPTNDLDLITLQVLEDFLLDFPGILLIVSHDRFFLDKLAGHLFVFEGDGQIRDFPGNYSEYREWKAEQDKMKARQESAARSNKTTAKPIVSIRDKAKRTYKEEQEFQALGLRISELEASKAAITQKFEQPEPGDDLEALSREMSALMAELDAAELRWLELSELEG